MSHFSRWFLDLVFPPFCVGCRASGDWVCTRCLHGISFAVPARNLDGLDSISSLGSYADPVLRAMITNMKYRSASCLQPAFRSLLERWHRGPNPDWSDLILIPIPSSDERITERGFDHVSALASILADANGLALDAKVLKRRRQSLSNADLESEDARRGNVHGAFETEGAVPERILLTDDVVTSGATAMECAKLLKKHGAREVHLFTWASGR